MSAAVPSVCVVGSANHDLVLRPAQLPAPGATVLSTERRDAAGGKGLNQAVAAARAGAATTLVAAIGRDAAGDDLLEAMREAGVDIARVRRVATRTGTAVVMVADDGENAIVVDPGANATLVSLDADDLDVVATASVVVAQHEVDARLVSATLAAATGTTVLNAAPVRTVPDPDLALVDVLVVNAGEAAALGGVRDPEQAAYALRDRVRGAVVVTLGADGLLLVEPDAAPVRLAARPARVRDTTGAGDTFVGHLAAGLAAGADLTAACHRAGVAASLSTERTGAVPSIPTAREVDAAVRASGRR